jgi:hypothetical protein
MMFTGWAQRKLAGPAVSVRPNKVLVMRRVVHASGGMHEQGYWVNESGIKPGDRVLGKGTAAVVVFQHEGRRGARVRAENIDRIARHFRHGGGLDNIPHEYLRAAGISPVGAADHPLVKALQENQQKAEKPLTGPPAGAATIAAKEQKAQEQKAQEQKAQEQKAQEMAEAKRLGNAHLGVAPGGKKGTRDPAAKKERRDRAALRAKIAKFPPGDPRAKAALDVLLKKVEEQAKKEDRAGHPWQDVAKRAMENEQALVDKAIKRAQEPKKLKEVAPSVHFPPGGPPGEQTLGQHPDEKRAAFAHMLRHDGVVKNTRRNPGGGINGSYKAELKMPDGTEVKVLLKPKSGEQIIFGLGGAGLELYKREAAASAVTPMFNVIGPVVTTRDLTSEQVGASKAGPSAVQEWFDRPGLQSKHEMTNIPGKVHRQDAEGMAAMDFVLGNHDRHGANLMAYPEGGGVIRLVAIDHGYSLPPGSPSQMRWNDMQDKGMAHDGVISSETKKMIADVDPVKLGKTLAANGIGRRSIAGALLRLAALKATPDKAIGWTHDMTGDMVRHARELPEKLPPDVQREMNDLADKMVRA